MNVVDAMQFLLLEMEAASTMGPGAISGTGSKWNEGVKVTVWDATRISYQLPQNVILHWSTVQVFGKRAHMLEYVVIHNPDTILPLTVNSVQEWITKNSEFVTVAMVESAISSLWAGASAIDPEQRKYAYRALTSLKKSFKLTR